MVSSTSNTHCRRTDAVFGMQIKVDQMPGEAKKKPAAGAKKKGAAAGSKKDSAQAGSKKQGSDSGENKEKKESPKPQAA